MNRSTKKVIKQLRKSCNIRKIELDGEQLLVMDDYDLRVQLVHLFDISKEGIDIHAVDLDKVRERFAAHI